MKISARNVLKAKVKKIVQGAVNAEVIIEIPDELEIVSIITRTSAENLELAVGKDAYAVVKVSDAMVGISHGVGE